MREFCSICVRAIQIEDQLVNSKYHERRDKTNTVQAAQLVSWHVCVHQHAPVVTEGECDHYARKNSCISNKP